MVGKSGYMARNGQIQAKHYATASNHLSGHISCSINMKFWWSANGKVGNIVDQCVGPKLVRKQSNSSEKYARGVSWWVISCVFQVFLGQKDFFWACFYKCIQTSGLKMNKNQIGLDNDITFILKTSQIYNFLTITQNWMHHQSINSY